MRHLLLINSAGNLMLADIENDIRMPIGAPLTPHQQARVSTAAWSERGQWTAWSVDSVAIDGVRQLRHHDEESDQASVLLDAVSSFYLNPSPCGRWLSHLSMGPLGLELALSEIRTGELRIIERGQPLFWAWSDDSTQIAMHVGHRVLVADIVDGSTRLLSDDAGSFVTPCWLPGGSVVYAIDDAIVAAGADGTVRSLVSSGSTGRFTLSPDSRQLAYLAVERTGLALVVMDLATLATTSVTSGPVAAFFWSPDGGRLAIVSAAGESHVQWIIADETGLVRSAPFRPTRSWAGTILPFFEQYAQSHTFWSHDASSLVAPTVDDAGRAGATLFPVDHPEAVRTIADAELAWFA